MAVKKGQIGLRGRLGIGRRKLFTQRHLRGSRIQQEGIECVR